jgi:hypothetical protein
VSGAESDNAKGFIMYYIDVFDADLKNWRAGVLAGIARKQSGPDITSQTVLYMLNAARAYANHLGEQFEPGFTQLLLSHRVLFFKKPGQTKAHYCMDLPSCRVLFGTKKLSFETVTNHIKSMVLYRDYEIKLCGDKEVTGNYFIRDINYREKTIDLDDNDNIVVVNPNTFEQVYPESLKNKGKVSPIFENFMMPMQMEKVLPTRIDEFLKKKR